jgi:hypothetical protein
VPVSPLGCSDGTARGVTVTVNPTPRVIPINLDPSICYTGTLLAPVNTQVVLTSPTVMTTGSMRFDYTVNVSGEPGVVVGNTSPAFNQTPGYTINYQYQIQYNLSIIQLFQKLIMQSAFTEEVL